ncbi:MAG: putative membrane associated protein [uncultured bacterium]|nr:MAG: putative membrane associated protein [uncultured bacterium]
MWVRSFLFIFLFLFTSFSYADQLIIEPDMGRKPIVDLLNQAQHSISLVMYGFTDETLLNALLKQHERGKSLKIILEQSPYKTQNENKKTIFLLKKNHIDWQNSIPPFRLVHQKTLIIDDKNALVMTFNFTHSSFKNQRNFALNIDEKKQVNAIKNIFSADWNHVPIHETSADLVVSPDNSRQKILALIKTATHSINVYAQSINDDKIIGALAKAARNGAHIKILTSAKIPQKQADFMRHAGIEIKQSKQLYIHAKVIIINNTSAMIGSINFTRASLENNRELSVITHNVNIVKQLNATFNHDWRNTSSFEMQQYTLIGAKILRKFITQTLYQTRRFE